MIYRHSESDSGLHAARVVWNDVFVNELGESNPDTPWGSELGAQVFLAYESSQVGKPAVAAAQLTPASISTMLVEHVAVLPKHRGEHIAAGLIQAMTGAAHLQSLEQLRLSARTDAIDFYQKLGFETIGEIFEDFGSPHIMMQKNLTG